jgi:hypothetical protein
VQGNPFRYGAPVGQRWFCDRQSELDGLLSTMRDGLHAFVRSPRRYGKTSLLLRALERFRSAGGRAGYVNLLFCTTEAEVASAVLAGVIDGTLTSGARARRSVGELVRHLRVQPRVAFGSDGRVELTLDPTAASSAWPGLLHDAIDLLSRSAGRRPTALMLDEFQVVAGIGRGGIGGAFKAAADAAATTSLIFSGSHSSVMERLTRGRGAPLEGMGERFVLDVIPEVAMVPYLQRRARAGGKRLAGSTASLIYREAGAIPNYVQWVAHAAFESSGSSTAIIPAHVQAGIDTVLERQAGDFAERFELLSPAQQRILLALSESPTAQPYRKLFLDRVQVANANAVTTALRVLRDRELVERRGGEWRVVNPFLRRWLTRRG